MLAAGSVTRSDSFSATMAGQPWFAWEWLFDLGAAVVHSRAGLNGVVWLTALVIAATFTLTLGMILHRGASLPVALVTILLAVCASTIHFFARPHVLGWLLTVIWFWILDSSEAEIGHRRRLFWLPVLMLAWANLHGGFVIGLVLCGLYLIGGWIQIVRLDAFGRACSRPWLWTLGWMTTLSALATLVNPYGYRLHLHIYRYLTDRFLMDHIEEFASPNFHGVAQQCFAVILLLALVAMAWSRDRVRPSQLLVVLFAAYSGLYASRSLPGSSLLLVLVAAPLLSDGLRWAALTARPPLRAWLVRFEAFAARMGRLEADTRGHLWAIAVVILGCVVSLNGGRLGGRPLMNAEFDRERFPVHAVDAIAGRGTPEPIFAPDYWGGYLINRLYPHNKVFIDDRHDFYGVPYLKKYLKVMHVLPGWEQVLADWKVHWILVPADSSLANILPERPGWKLVYQDRQARLFETAGGD